MISLPMSKVKSDMNRTVAGLGLMNGKLLLV